MIEQHITLEPAPPRNLKEARKVVEGRQIWNTTKPDLLWAVGGDDDHKLLGNISRRESLGKHVFENNRICVYNISDLRETRLKRRPKWKTPTQLVFFQNFVHQRRGLRQAYKMTTKPKQPSTPLKETKANSGTGRLVARRAKRHSSHHNMTVLHVDGCGWRP